MQNFLSVRHFVDSNMIPFSLQLISMFAKVFLSFEA